MASKHLLRALKDLPDAVRNVIVRAEGEAAKRVPKSTGSMAVDLATYPYPKARAVVSKASKGLATASRTVDEAAGGQLRRLPGVGRLFEKKRRITLKEYPGGTKVKAEVPVGSAIEPARKAGRLAVPVLALVGYESLTQPPTTKESQMAECNHEEMLAKAGSALRQLQKENELLVEKVANLQIRREAESVVGHMVESGLVTKEEHSTKVAEIVSGQMPLPVARAAMQFRGVMPKLGELEEGPGSGVANPDGTSRASGDSYDDNEAIRFLVEEM